MFNFNLKEAAIFPAVKWGRYLRFAGVLKKLFLILFIFILLSFFYGFLGENFSQNLNSKLLGLSIIFLIFTIGLWFKLSFLNSKLKKPKLKVKIEEAISKPEEYNLAEFLSFKAAKAVDKSIKFAQKKKISEISSTVLFYNLLIENPNLNFIFSRALLNFNEIKKLFKNYLEKLPSSTKTLEVRLQQSFQETIL